MERLADWLWRRYKAHYLAVLLAQMLALPFLVIAPSILSWKVALDRPWSQALELTALFVAVAVVLPLPGLVVLSRRQSAAFVAYCRDHETPPELVRPAVDKLYRIPWIWAAAAGTGGGVAAWFFADWADISDTARPGLVMAIVTIVLGSATTTWIGWDSQLRPVRAELDRQTGDDTPARLQRPVYTRMFVMTTIFLLAAAWWNALFVSAFDDAQVRYLWAGPLSVACAVWIGVVGIPFVVGSITSPIVTLTAGAQRVAQGDFGERVPVTSEDELGQLSRAFNRMQRGLAERARLHAAFGSYVDPALAEQLIEKGRDTFDGQRVDVTVLFADVRGFTTYSESHTAEESVAMLSELFGVIVPILVDHGGHANKFLGDGLMAVFGTPRPLEEHADRAVDAAIAIQHKIVRTFGDAVRVGIGINTGSVIAGTLGGGGKLEFTLIGDAVNVAARIENLTKETGDPILISGQTVAALRRPVATLPRGEHEIRGRTGRIDLYALNAW